jgi:type IV fimbrial biogenesis protein FimT
MVTVTVFAILIAVAVPGLNQFMQRQAVEGAAEQFSGDLRYARTEAMKRGQPVSISIRTETNNDDAITMGCANAPGTQGFSQGWLVFSDLNGDGDLDTDDGEVILRDQQAPSSQLTSMLPNAGTGYTMQHTGIMLAGAGNITVLPKGGATLQRMLCISMVGRARVTAIGATQCA